MTGVFDKTDREIAVGDHILFGDTKHKVVLINGADGLKGYFAQSLQMINGEFSIVRYSLQALNPKQVRVI